MDVVPKRYTFRAQAPAAGYTTGTYAFFIESPAPVLTHSITVNFSRISVVKVPRGAPYTNSLPYLQTTTIPRSTYQSPVGYANQYVVGDGTTDDTNHLLVALTDNKVLYYGSSTIFLPTTTSIGSAQSVHKFLPGAKLRIGAGATVTINGTIDAPSNQQIFQIDSGGSLVWGTNNSRTVQAPWFGAICSSLSHDDAPGINAAIASIATNGGAGGTVEFPVCGQGYYVLLSQIKIGASSTGPGQNYQGITLKGEYQTISGDTLTTFLCVAELGKGNPMMLIQNNVQFYAESLGFDAANLADYCVQNRADTIAGSGYGGAHQNSFSRCTFRRGRIHNVLNGEATFSPTVSGTVFTAAGHPLANNDTLYFRLRFPGVDVLPTGISATTVYFVVQVGVAGAGTFKLSLTSGGSPVTTTDGGFGVWLIQKTDDNDVSQFVLELCEFGGCGFEDIRQSSQETLGCSLRTCWGQGNPGGTGFTGVVVHAVASTDTITLTSGTLHNGDVVAIWRNGSGDTMAGGLTEDTLYVVFGASGASGKLAASFALAASSTAVDITSDADGTTGHVLRLNQFIAPYRFCSLDGGSMKADACVSAPYYEDYLVCGGYAATGVTNQGSQLTIQDQQSQSWRLLNATEQGRGFATAVGGIAVNDCNHADVIGGSRASIIWDLSFFTSLTVKGGMLYRDVYVKNATTNVTITGPSMVVYGADNGFQATIRGDLSKTCGSWSENGTVVSRGVNLKTYGPTTIGDGTGIVTIDNSSANYINLRALTSYFDIDALNFRKLNATALASLTSPSGTNTQLEAVSTLILKGDTGLTIDSGSGTLTATVNTHNILVASSALTLDSSGIGGFLNLKTGAGQAIYYDSDTHNFRTSAAVQNLAISRDGSGNAFFQSIAGITLDAGAANAIAFQVGTQKLFSVINASSQSTLFVDSTSVGFAIQANNSGQYIELFASVGNFFDGPAVSFRDGSQSPTITWSIVSSGATSAQIAATVTSFTINQGDNSTNSATGASITIQAQNTTGTTSIGGDLILSPGSGTSSNGKLTFNNLITTGTAPGAGGGSALPATPAGYATIKINGVSRQIAYY